MLRLFIIISAVVLIISCSDNSNQLSELQSKVTELQKKVDEAYKPGLGEFMSNIQVHHAKLWFAGINQNWELADFEIHEIKESFDDIRKYQSDMEETKMILIINPALDSLENAIEAKNVLLFKDRFTTLTNTCNSCHEAVKFEFNKVKIPDSPPFSNQVFNKK
jgi:phosphoenolpyruvate carboxylase